MFLRQLKEGHLIEVNDVQELINPLHKTVTGRLHYGEEMQDPEQFDKANLVFPSGEPLPKCWTTLLALKEGRSNLSELTNC